jgi:hypothetical protein
VADATPPPELAMPQVRNAGAARRLRELAAQNVQEEMHGLRNLTVIQNFAILVMLWWFDKFATSYFWLASFFSACLVVYAFAADVADAVAIVREAIAEARAAGAPAGLSDEARAGGVTDEEYEEVVAYFEAMDDYSDEGRLFWSTRGGPPLAKPADLAAAALGGVAAYVALVVPLTL